jgi:hypothetical protein
MAERLRSTRPRRILAPAGAVALSAIVVATAVISIQGEGESPTRLAAPGAGRAGATSAPPLTGTVAPAVKPSAGHEANSGAAEAAGGSSALQLEEALPESSAARSGPYASHAGHRDVERAATMVLGAEPDKVREAAAGVFEAVHAANGIVLRSSISNGTAGRAGAQFELLIPSAKLGDALASISSVAEVRSRHESADDITAPTVSVGERLADANAAVRSVLAQLAGANTEAERAAAEAELRAARATAAALRSRLSSLDRRASLSRVSVRIETSETAAGEGGGAWGIGDGLDSAGRVLAVAAGVSVIALAILAPLALIALLAWLAHRAWLRRSRSRALGRA